MIKFENVSFTYDGSNDYGLKNINATIKDGECILLCGRSGCGKTTFTRIVNGLIPHYYHGKFMGSVTVNGLNTTKSEMCKISGEVGSVFQNPRTQFFNTDTDSEIAFGLENKAVATNELQKIVAVTEKDLNIEHLSQRNIFELSGGEKQKIAFASIYASKPNIFLLDEPSSNLDVASINELTQILKNVKHQGKTILIAEHRLSYLIEIVDRIFYFKEGRLVSIFKPQELRSFSKEQIEKLGLRSVDMANVKPMCNPKVGFHNNLKLKDVVIKQENRILLNHINFTAHGGEVVVITGSNGSGKTTLSRSICGLHKNMAGKISINDHSCGRKELMKQVYLVMQDVNYQLFAESVENECVLGIKNPNFALVTQSLKDLELLIFAKVHPNTLSGGQKQRLAVAVSMISQNDILVFDEPTSGLDFDSMTRVANLINHLSKMGKIIFVTTHDYEFACRVCSRIIYLKDGKIVLNEQNVEEKEDLLRLAFSAN